MPTKNELTLLKISRHFSTEDAALAYFEQMRWPNGPICPHCGNENRERIYKRSSNPSKKIRTGLYVCAECEGTFTVRVGTVMEDSHIPLRKWLIAFFMMCASKTQISALQVQMQLELGSYRTAQFLCQRIRLALADSFPDSQPGGIVEADEGYIKSGRDEECA